MQPTRALADLHYKMSTMTSSDGKASPEIIVITGNMAAGKSSVAQALTERLPRSVHLRGDLFRRMIVNGRAEMGFELSPEAQDQLALRYELAVHTAKRYADSGFTVVYQDIILGDTLAELEAKFHPYQPSIVVLCPRAEVIEKREQGRQKSGYRDRAMIDAFDTALHERTPRIGYWLDSSELTVSETVEDILTHFGRVPRAR